MHDLAMSVSDWSVSNANILDDCEEVIISKIVFTCTTVVVVCEKCIKCSG